MLKQFISGEAVINPIVTKRGWTLGPGDISSGSLSIYTGSVWTGSTAYTPVTSSTGYDPVTVWSSLQHMLVPGRMSAFGPTAHSLRSGYQTCDVIGINGDIFGDNIIPGSIRITDNSPVKDVIFIDDGGGLLTYSTSSGSDPGTPLLHLGFDELVSGSIATASIWVASESIRSVRGVSGPAVSIKDERIILRDPVLLTKPWSLSFWSLCSSVNTYQVVSSSGFLVSLNYTTNTLTVSANGETDTFNVLSASIATGAWNNVVITTYNDRMHLFSNGQLLQTVTHSNATSSLITHIGSINNTAYFELDEVRAFDRSLTPDEVSFLYNRPGGSEVVGAVSYGAGLIAIPGYEARFIDLFSTADYSISFSSSRTIYQHSYTCIIEPGEFTKSTNPSMRYMLSGSEYFLNFTTTSVFTPYFTTIGLYNEHDQLLATAKMSNPTPILTTHPLIVTVNIDF